MYTSKAEIRVTKIDVGIVVRRGCSTQKSEELVVVEREAEETPVARLPDADLRWLAAKTADAEGTDVVDGPLRRALPPPPPPPLLLLARESILPPRAANRGLLGATL